MLRETAREREREGGGGGEGGGVVMFYKCFACKPHTSLTPFPFLSHTYHRLQRHGVLDRAVVPACVPTPTQACDNLGEIVHVDWLDELNDGYPNLIRVAVQCVVLWILLVVMRNRKE